MANTPKGSSKARAPLVCLVSRCAWTFFNFRLRLALEVSKDARVMAAGVDVEPYTSRIVSTGVPFARVMGRIHGQNPIFLLLFGLDLYRLYRRSRPTVVHHFTIKPVIFGTLAARLAGVPKIVNTISGLGKAFDEQRSLPAVFARLLYRISLRFSHHVFFQNDEDRLLFIKEGLVAEAATSVVPGSGVDLERFRPAEREQGTTPVVLMVARLLKTKGVREFVDAARIVKDHRPEVEFVLVGGLDFGNPASIEEPELRTWEAQGLISWKGHQDDTRPFVERAQVVVLPSYYREGVPRVLLEAAAMGKPIVTTDNTGCREVVEDGVNGLLVPPRDPEALAKAISTLLEDETLRARFGRESRRVAEERFDERYIVRRTIEVYRLNG